MLDLARAFPGTTLVITAADTDGLWPEIAEHGLHRDRLLPAGPAGDTANSALEDVAVFRITCP